MCGIAGAVYLNRNDKEKAINFTYKAIEEIIHRGPDGNGIFETENSILGSCRLAINDLRETANMPMISNCAGYILVYNGELYNFKELRKSLENEFEFKTNSDTEVVLNYFIKFGAKCFDYFEGMYALAIWDKSKQELTIARDRLGKKPIFLKLEKDIFYYCSEITPLINTQKANSNLNDKVLNEIALFGEFSNKETVYKKIHRLLPNTYMTLKINSLDFKFKKNNYKNLIDKNRVIYSNSENNLYLTLKESIKKRLISDRPVGVALSGGTDSAVLCKIISESDNPKPPTFTIRFNKKDDEVSRAEIIAKKYNLDHYVIDYEYEDNYFLELIKKIGEPYCDPAIAYLSFLCKSLPKNIKVLITGDGGDEAFLGYDKYLASYKYNKTPKILKKILLNSQVKNQIFKNDFTYKLSNRLSILSAYSSETVKEMEYDMFLFLKNYISSDSLNDILKITKERSKRYPKFFEKLELYKNYCFHDITTRLPGRYLPKVDLAGAFNGVEIRSPYLDDKLLSEAISKTISGNHSLLGKPFLKNILLKDFKKSYVYNKKRGFSPSVFNLNQKMIEKSLKDLKLKNITSLINDLSESFLANKSLRKHWYSKSLLWNLICINSWYSN